MKNDEKIEAILDLAKGLSAAELHDLSEDFDDLTDKQCEIEGHTFGDDHCGKPEHRFCYVCEKPETPRPARQAKANEAVANKATLPSESLGSGSIFRRWFTQ